MRGRAGAFRGHLICLVKNWSNSSSGSPGVFVSDNYDAMVTKVTEQTLFASCVRSLNECCQSTDQIAGVV